MLVYYHSLFGATIWVFYIGTVCCSIIIHVPVPNFITFLLDPYKLGCLFFNYRIAMKCMHECSNRITDLNLIFKVPRTNVLTYSQMYRHRVKLYKQRKVLL